MGLFRDAEMMIDARVANAIGSECKGKEIDDEVDQKSPGHGGSTCNRGRVGLPGRHDGRHRRRPERRRAPRTPGG